MILSHTKLKWQWRDQESEQDARTHNNRHFVEVIQYLAHNTRINVRVFAQRFR